LIGKRAKRAVIVSQRTRHIARLAQIPSASLGTGSSLRKERLFRMTIKLHHYQTPAKFDLAAQKPNNQA
jgi:hypothetical protein